MLRWFPSPRGLLGLLGTTSSYLLALATLTTIGAKAIHLGEIRHHQVPLSWLLYLVSADAALYLGCAAALLVLEHRVPRLRWLTLPAVVVLGLLALANAAYLLVAGDQASRAAVEALIERFDDVLDIATEEARAGRLAVLALLAATATVVGALGRRWLRRGPLPATERVHRAAVTAAWLAAAAGIATAVTPPPRSAELRRLSRNAVVSLVDAYLGTAATGTFRGYGATGGANPLPGAATSAAADAAPRRPNVVLLVLESTRYDHTSLVGSPGLASTPHLARLAEGAFQVPVMRAVVPHTTKALFTMLCGRLPLMQRELWELSATVQVDCLPKLLASLGYRTAFLQSAQGLFEQRARLVDKLGYEHFVSWEDIRGQRLGYLASDDLSLMRPLQQWLDAIADDGQPFFVTLLTSATHHPYAIPTRVELTLAENHRPHGTDAERYARLVEEHDALLGEVIDLLHFRSLHENTIVIAIGDHGEGFGEHSFKQHDQNLHEEGVRVPWVVAGPGIPTRTVKGNASAVDVLPTLATLLHLPENLRPATFPWPGFDLVDQDVPPSEPRWMSCWFAERCRAVVAGDTKVMEEPDGDERYWFDLAADPTEQAPHPLGAPQLALLERLRGVVASQTVSDGEIVHPELRKYGLWWCPADDERCKHPRARHPKFRWELPPGMALPPVTVPEPPAAPDPRKLEEQADKPEMEAGLEGADAARSSQTRDRRGPRRRAAGPAPP